MTTSACPVPSRAEGIAARSAPMRMWLVTAPPFCAMPVWSSTLAALPSRCAAIASTAPTVSTPVPPMPVTSRAWGACATSSTAGAGSFAAMSASAASSNVRLRRVAPCDFDEAGAKALYAAVILVAGRLVDRALAAELGLDRGDRKAVRLHRTIAAAFADRRVDVEPLVRIGQCTALAAAALLVGASLLVNDS